MTEAITTARKWGNSVGVTLPAEVIREEHIKPNDKVMVKVKKVVPIKELFGTLKTKRSTQSLKDELRTGWEL